MLEFRSFNHRGSSPDLDLPLFGTVWKARLSKGGLHSSETPSSSCDVAKRLLRGSKGSGSCNRSSSDFFQCRSPTRSDFAAM
eukprot:CAMPEP_0170253300 /NCGR_PEP_ID=MMETSP0116_2-20130129/26489_1 /TAXON_ID=400756 /ORGANISM="Durinskia baltica, Strain CSIRO CS-38" /LENGTH=81 /DNA_ID=CAMNT_0010504281 /DNA_START=133 /DNA_END=378 /DNA_ORIENTATION=+